MSELLGTPSLCADSWRARAVINTAAFADNIARVRELAANSLVMAVVKANAYGHGIESLAGVLAQADSLAVIDVAEARIVRRAQPVIPLTILQGVNSDADAEWCVANQVSPALVDISQLSYLLPIAPALTKLWLKLDSGMHRLGVQPEQLTPILEALKKAGFVGELGLLSHFACADESQTVTEQQIAVFDEAVKKGDFAVQSLANSAGIIDFPNSQRDVVRPGIMLYGSSPFAARSADSLGLKPVMSLQAKVAALHQLSACVSVGYGLAWTAEESCQVAVVSAGYGDGLPRNLATGTEVSISGQRGKLVGRVSMDSCFVAFAPKAALSIGDIATFWGQTADGDVLPVDDVAHACGTIAYELLCRIAPRVPRVRLDQLEDMNGG